MSKMTDREICEKIKKVGGRCSYKYCNYNFKDSTCPIRKRCSYHTSRLTVLARAKQWLRDNPETVHQQRIAMVKSVNESLKPMTKREYLIKQVKLIEAHKAEFNKTVDKAIESLHNQMTCRACYLQEDGRYDLHVPKLDAEDAIAVADFIKDMESTWSET